MATTSTAVQKKADLLPAPLLALVQGLMPDVYRLLPPDISDDQFRAACWLEITGRRELHDCVMDSIRDSIIYAANYGLMPGRDCHFLPFKQKKYGGKKGSQCIANYFGILRTLDRSGKVRRAFAHAVHEGDEWGFDMFQDRPVHKPAVTLGKKPGKELFYYGAIMFLDGTCAFEVMTLEDLEKIKQRAPAHDSGPWVTDAPMMKRKTALKRVAKYVQLTPEQRSLLDLDDAREKDDIPPARHRQNIVDLFGDPQVDPTTHGHQYNVTPQGTFKVDPETGQLLEDDDTGQESLWEREEREEREGQA